MLRSSGGLSGWCLTLVALVAFLIASMGVGLSMGGGGVGRPLVVNAPAAVRLASPFTPAPPLPLSARPRRAPEPAIRRLLRLGLPIYCGGHRGRDLALTFDDGPGPYTHLALRKLARAHERATFFVVGLSMQQHPGYLRAELRVAALGDHTFSHPPLTTLPRRQVVAQLRTTARMIERGTGINVDLFRPPYELHDAMVDRVADRLGLLEILWDVDSQDALGADRQRIVSNVLAGLEPGAIIELHENHGTTISALNAILRAVHRRHMVSVSVPHLLAVDPPSLPQVRAGYLGCGADVAHGHE